jgi:glycosyltransferase involved in cell wall biosynthesis
LLNALTLLSLPYRLTIAGDGEANYVEQLKDLARSKNIDDNIDWVGFQGDDKFRLLGQHDLLVLPSFDENFGNVIIESLSVGTAVLISPFVGLAGYVEENKFGWISDIDADSFSTAIGQIRNNPTELDRIKTSAPAKIREDFEANNLCDRYIKMYDTILNG